MLSDLPVELILKIISSLSIRDLITISEVNKQLLKLSRDDYIWTPLLLRDHPNVEKIYSSYMTYRYVKIPVYEVKEIIDFQANRSLYLGDYTSLKGVTQAIVNSIITIDKGLMLGIDQRQNVLNYRLFFRFPEIKRSNVEIFTNHITRRVCNERKCDVCYKVHKYIFERLAHEAHARIIKNLKYTSVLHITMLDNNYRIEKKYATYV